MIGRMRCRSLSVLFGIAVVAGMSHPLASGQSAHEEITPILLAVQDAPVPFRGSDGRMHLVYELWVTNFSSGEVSLEKVDVLGDGAVIQSLDRAAIAQRLQPAGQRDSVEVLPKSTQALLFLHLTLAPGGAVPHEVSHQITARVLAAPPGHQEITESGGMARVDRREVVRIGPPLQGEGYISADSCCDATRHTRAALPVNGKVYIAQRYAVDWEQVDAAHRIYSGPQQNVESYAIANRPAIAVADAEVESVTDRYPQQTPGKFPTDIGIEEADGNSVVLNLGGGRYALYAHLKPGSIRVRAHEKVKRGQVLGEVGNSGNSVAPHLHFHVMDGPSPLAANGLPYEIDQYEVTGRTAGTTAFDKAEAEGTPLAITPVIAEHVRDGLPLDQLIVTFGGAQRSTK